MDETIFLQGVARKAARVSGRPGEGSEALSRIVAGDRRALEEIHARYSREIFRYLLTLVPAIVRWPKRFFRIRSSPCGGGGGRRSLSKAVPVSISGFSELPVARPTTSRNLAVLADGQVLFQGTTASMIEAARGKVWEIETDGPKPGGGLTVVSTLHFGNSVRYRVVGDASAYEGAEKAAPSLKMVTCGSCRNGSPMLQRS